ncbi:MAG: Hsp33 family molecular chaperone HslO [Herbaspirillum sp.]
MSDTLQKFMLETGNVRGELVELRGVWQQALEHHHYPAPVQALLGQMLAAAALLTANLKFDGALIMQIHGDGPVRLLVVECDTNLRLRATAKLIPDAIIDTNANITQLINANGNGHFAITLDPTDRLPGQQPYQGIVALEGDSMAAIIETYMLRSEQLDTKLWLAADAQVARGLLLQRLPENGGNTATLSEASHELTQEAWQRMVALGSTLKTAELLTTNTSTLLHRLFWEETLRVFDPLSVQFHCGCNRDKVGNMLKMLGQAEVQEALVEQGQLSIACDFCGKEYSFDKVDCAQLFASNAPAETLLPPSPAQH